MVCPGIERSCGNHGSRGNHLIPSMYDTAQTGRRPAFTFTGASRCHVADRLKALGKVHGDWASNINTGEIDYECEIK